MIYVLIAAGVIVVALCLHYSTSSYGIEEDDVSSASSYIDYGPDMIDSMEAEIYDQCTNPAYSNLGGNAYHGAYGDDD